MKYLNEASCKLNNSLSITIKDSNSKLNANSH